jgi:hypothetical protein
MELETLRIVALHNPIVWKYLRILNHEYADVFSAWNYEQAFRIVRVDRYGVSYTLNNKLHRSGGPAIICKNGDTYWYRFGKLHRIGGPAIDTQFLQMWSINGRPHRLDGPSYYYAIKLSDDQVDIYCINGRILTKERYDKRIRFYKKIGIYNKMLNNRFTDDHIIMQFPFTDSIS